MCVCVSVHVHAGVCLCVSVCACACACKHVCVCLCGSTLLPASCIPISRAVEPGREGMGTHLEGHRERGRAGYLLPASGTSLLALGAHTPNTTPLLFALALGFPAGSRMLCYLKLYIRKTILRPGTRYIHAILIDCVQLDCVKEFAFFFFKLRH